MFLHTQEAQHESCVLFVQMCISVRETLHFYLKCLRVGLTATVQS